MPDKTPGFGFQCNLDERNPVKQSLPLPGPGGGKQKGVSPYVARRLASNVAILSAMIMVPMRALMSQMSPSLDFVEVACAPTSSLTSRMDEMGYSTALSV